VKACAALLPQLLKAVGLLLLLQVPAYLFRNKQTIAQEKQQLEEYIKLREQPVSPDCQ
jgi:hypothetical protein